MIHAHISAAIVHGILRSGLIFENTYMLACIYIHVYIHTSSAAIVHGVSRSELIFENT